MSWSAVKVKSGKRQWMGLRNSSTGVVSVPFESAIEKGDDITCDGRRFEVLTSTDFAQRGEQLHLTVEAEGDKKETKNGSVSRSVDGEDSKAPSKSA